MKLATIDQPDREKVLAAIEAAAFDEGKGCEHCGGAGRVEGGRRIIHSQLGAFGADWDAEQVAELVRTSGHIRWGAGFLNHDLAVRNGDGKWVFFAVPHPDRPSTT